MHKFIFSAWIVALLMLSACTQPIAYSAESAGVTVTVRFGAALYANAAIPVQVSFTQSGEPYAVADVVLDLQMPGMTMGTSKPMAIAQPDGSHTTTVLFTMDGEWAIVVTGRSARGDERFVINQIIVSP
jgi:hypothetical protein